jgi:hypothetical protein
VWDSGTWDARETTRRAAFNSENHACVIRVQNHLLNDRIEGRTFMKSIRLLALIIGLMSITTLAQTKSKPLAFTHVTVIDATGAVPQREMVVVITGDKITDIGRFGKVKLPKSAQVIDAKGKFLIPGLWDMHVHLGKAGENSLPLFISNGTHERA